MQHVVVTKAVCEIKDRLVSIKDVYTGFSRDESYRVQNLFAIAVTVKNDREMSGELALLVCGLPEECMAAGPVQNMPTGAEVEAQNRFAIAPQRRKPT